MISDALRDDLAQRVIRAVIPPRSNRTNTICYNQRLYRQRNCIERALGHLKINRVIATRYAWDAISRNRALLNQICPRGLAVLWQIWRSPRDH
jgi:transposase